MAEWLDAKCHYGNVEYQVTVGGKVVEYLFNKDREETFDPLDAIEYMDYDEGILTIKPHQHVIVKTGRREYTGELK